jgi:hypothetical protein
VDAGVEQDYLLAAEFYIEKCSCRRKNENKIVRAGIFCNPSAMQDSGINKAV